MPKYAKIPKNAKIVYRGRLYTVYTWKQRLYDGSYANYETVKRKDSVHIIPIIGRRIAIAYVREPGWKSMTLIGGRMEDKESPQTTAKRELLEEGGFQSNDFEMLEKLRPTSVIDYYTHVFVARNCKKFVKQNPGPGEKIIVKQMNFENFLKKTTEFGPVLNAYFSQFRESESKKEWFKRKLFR